jgi:osmotically-inducible protein OsmY
MGATKGTRDAVGAELEFDPLVQDALHRNALVGDDSDISVDSSGNAVTLRGHVLTWAEHDAVVGAAWMAGGVMQVRDDLDITS